MTDHPSFTSQADNAAEFFHIKFNSNEFSVSFSALKDSFNLMANVKMK